MTASCLSTGKKRSSLLFIAVTILMAVEWILLVAGTRGHEMIVGGFSVLLSVLFLWNVHRFSSLRLRFEVHDVAQCWRIPWSVLSRDWEITIILFRDLFLSRHAESLYRVCGFDASKHDHLLVGRQVLATVYTTAAPNFIVIGIDAAQSRMLFHQIERTCVSKMTTSLGARP
jgi:hypothetical protein